MRLQLGRIDTTNLAVELPGTRENDPPQQVRIQSATGLEGVLEKDSGSLRLSDVHCEHVALDVLRLVFGTVRVELEGEGVLERLRVAFEQRQAESVLDLHADVRADGLTIRVGDMLLRGAVRIDAIRVQVDGHTGRIEADHVHVSALELTSGTARVNAEQLVGQRLVLRWGEEFSLQAEAVSVPALAVEADTVRVRGTELMVKELAVQGERVAAAQAQLGSVTADVSLVPGPAAQLEPTHSPPSPPSESGGNPPVFDWRLLDGLDGELAVDLFLDLTVPVVGWRRATHKFRVPIEGGTIDFIRLENDLATLENTLLDFAVRDGALVLERGIPLLPTRGRGKPIVAWRLSNEDLFLAEQRRVRLSVLPRAELVGASSEEPERASTPSVALRRLGVHNLRAALRLAPEQEPIEGVLQGLRFGALEIHGEVHHEPDAEPLPGRIDAAFSDVETAIVGLPLLRRRLFVEALRVARAPHIELHFEGIKPRQLRVELTDLVLERVMLPEP